MLPVEEKTMSSQFLLNRTVHIYLVVKLSSRKDQNEGERERERREGRGGGPGVYNWEEGCPAITSSTPVIKGVVRH